MTLYGVDPARVGEAIATHAGVPADAVDFSSLAVASASSRAGNMGPSLEVHLLRNLSAGLPHFWTLAASLRFRF
jgi:hypothetical protein